MSNSSEFIRRFSQADAGTRARLEAGCNFINHKIEELRRRVVFAFFASALAALIWWQATGIDWRWPVIGFVLVFGTVRVRALRELTRWYKKMVINRVVEALGQGLTYSLESGFTRATFRDINLFDSRIDSFKSEDQISGRKDQVAYTLHEVLATREERRGKNTRTVTVFRGVIVELDFNKHFHGHTVVVADRESKRLGGLLGESQARKDKTLVPLADADFEKVYSVYSTDPQEAHYVLTPKLIQLVLRARNRFGDIRLAFYENSLFVTVPSNVNRFEVGLFSRVTPMTAIDELADMVALAEQLVDAFDLETRIWTRA